VKELGQGIWGIHDEMHVTRPPRGPDDREVVSRLKAMLAELDWRIETADGTSDVWARHIRCIARSRMIKAAETPIEASTVADLATEDALAVLPTLRDTVLRGEAGVKPYLGNSVQRLATILHWRPDPDLNTMRAAEDWLREYLSLSAPSGMGISAATRLAQAMAELADSGALAEADARSLAGGCQEWVNRAFDLLAQLPEVPSDPNPIAEMAGVLGSSSMIALLLWTDPLDGGWFFELVGRRWHQLETLKAQAPKDDPEFERMPAVVEGMILKAIFDACQAIVDSFEDRPATPEIWAEVHAFRRMIHLLPEELWDRSGSAVEILARREPDSDQPLRQIYLDGIEMGLIGAAIAGMASAAPQLDEMGEEDSEVVAAALMGGTWLLLANMEPGVSKGYLAATMALTSHEESEATEVEAEFAGVLESAGEVDQSSEAFGTLALIHMNGALTRLFRQSEWEMERLRKEVWSLVETICRPVSKRDERKGGRLFRMLFVWTARMIITRPADQLKEAIEWIGEAEASLGELGITEPVLELARAELAFALTARDRSYHDVVNRAAGAFVRHVEAHPDLPDDLTAFDTESLVRALRLHVVSDRVQRSLDPERPEDDATVRSLARLRKLAQDPGLEEDDRKLAGEAVAEIEVLRLVDAKEFSALIQADWQDLVGTRAVTFLLGLVEAEPEQAAAVDPALAQRAIATALRQARSLDSLRSAQEGRFLEALTTSRAIKRLNMKPTDALGFGNVAAEIFEPIDADSAEIPLAVAMNLRPLIQVPATEVGYRELVEEVGERFMPVLLDDPVGRPSLPHFMSLLGGLAQNLGAVRAAEFVHRQRLTLAAHLLTVRLEDADGAAFTAYEIAEFFRLGQEPEKAMRWMGVYDSWLTTGALGMDSQAPLRQAIEFDRGQLLRDLRPPGTDSVAPKDLGPEIDADIAGRLTNLVNALASDPGHPLNTSDADLLAEIPGLDLPPLALLHHWALALGICTRAAACHPQHDLIASVTVAIGEELLGRRDIPEAIGRTAALPLLESLVDAAIAAGDSTLAERALRRLSAALNQLFLSNELGPSFLTSRPTGNNLRGAALRAFDQIDRRMAVEVAEAGRMKLLSSIAAARSQPGPTAVEEVPRVPRDRPPLPDELAALIANPSREDIGRLVGTQLDDDALAAVVRSLALPWVRLATSRGGSVSGSEVSDEIWQQALIEPSLEWIFRSLAENQLLVYPFLTDGSIGAVIVTSQSVFSFLRPLEGFPDGTTASTIRHLVGSEILQTTLVHLAETGMTREDWDVRFVAWDSDTDLAAQQIATGFWLTPMLARAAGQEAGPEPGLPPTIMPTARLLRARSNRPHRPPRAVGLLGDPTEDLPGTWIEAIAWEDRFGDRLRPHMGKAATREAALTCLRECDVVVISGHADGDAGGTSLRLADGVLFHGDLLLSRRDIRASTVILSCCWGALTAQTVKTEVMGLATTLLALGVQEVLAPLVPIDDPAAGVVGAYLASAVAEGSDLREALSRTAEAILGAPLPPVSSQLPTGWAEICPHDQETLDSRTNVSPDALLATLCEFSVFGSGLVPSGEAAS
jgi:hypothetical protein